MNGPRPPRRVRGHRHAAHRLDTAGHGEVVRTGDHALRGEVHRLLRRPALPIDRRAGHRLGQPCAHPRVADHVGRLLPHLGDATADHVVDALGVDSGPRHEVVEHQPEQIGRMPARQPALALADRRADGVDDDRFTWRHPATLSDARVRFPGLARARSLGHPGINWGHRPMCPRARLPHDDPMTTTQHPTNPHTHTHDRPRSAVADGSAQRRRTPADITNELVGNGWNADQAATWSLRSLRSTDHHHLVYAGRDLDDRHRRACRAPRRSTT